MARSFPLTSISTVRPSPSSEMHSVAYDESLANRVRTALGNTRRVQERRMFGGLVFMVREKMCISVGKERIMCRLDPAIHNAALKHKGGRTVVMRGRPCRGYVYIDAEVARTKRQLDYWYWVHLALDQNGSSRKRAGKLDQNRPLKLG